MFKSRKNNRDKKWGIILKSRSKTKVFNFLFKTLLNLIKDRILFLWFYDNLIEFIYYSTFYNFLKLILKNSSGLILVFLK